MYVRGLWTPRSEKAVINIMAVWLHGMSDPWNISVSERLVRYGSVSFGIVQIHHPQLREGGAAATGGLLVY